MGGTRRSNRVSVVPERLDYAEQAIKKERKANPKPAKRKASAPMSPSLSPLLLDRWPTRYWLERGAGRGAGAGGGAGTARGASWGVVSHRPRPRPRLIGRPASQAAASKALKRASRAANLPPAPMEDRTNGRRGGSLSGLSPISANNSSLDSFAFGELDESPMRLGASEVAELSRGIGLIGRQVRKDFMGTVHRGKILAYDEDDKTYAVRYDDGDEEDVEEEEVLANLVKRRGSGRERRPDQSGLSSSTASAASVASAASAVSTASAASAASTASAAAARKPAKAAPPKKRRPRKESKTEMQAREAKTKAFIYSQKQYFSDLDSHELEFE